MEWFQNWIDSLPLWLVIILFLVGLGAIIKGGDWFVDAASWIAEKTGIPKLIIGATVVSFATTLPELLVSVFATISGDIGIATGNAIGSVTANLGLIMGISLVWLPSVIRRKDYILKSILMIVPLVVMFAFSFNGKADGTINIWCAIILFVIFAINIFDNVYGAVKETKKLPYEEKKEEDIKELNKEIGNEKPIDDTTSLADSKKSKKPKKEKKPLSPAMETTKNILLFIVGALGIIVGAELLVSTSTNIASSIGVSDTVIGLTIVAIGTSLPELVTTITALVKKESSLSVGNIIGANIIDLTMILSICAFVGGGTLSMSEQNILLDIPVCLVEGLIALVPALITGKFRRWQGIAMLAVYIAYVVILVVGVGALGITPAA